MNNVSNTSNVIKYENSIAQIHEQHLEKLSLDDQQILEYLDWNSLANLSLVNKAWHQCVRKLVRYTKPEIENFVDLTLYNKIQKCVAANFKRESYVNAAMQLAKRFYEVNPRGIHDNKYGAAFTMTPELLYYAMFLAKNETVLEVAGASGENAALLAFSGANRVYMNDIVPEEISAFKRLVSTLPEQVQSKIEPIRGDCLNLDQLKPELIGSVGLLICHNLLHFFNDKQQEAFFEMMKKVLKPGGMAIFTVNACYSTPTSKEIFESYPEQSAWLFADCLEHNYLISDSPISVVHRFAMKSQPSEVSVNFKQYYLWLKDNTTGYKWIEDRSGYKALPDEAALKLKQVVDKKFKSMQNYRMGSVRMVMSAYHMFNQNNLAALFKKAGFEVQNTFLIDGKGHLAFTSDPYGKVLKIGIVVKSPKKV